MRICKLYFYYTAGFGHLAQIADYVIQILFVWLYLF